jgi:glutaredoxin 3
MIAVQMATKQSSSVGSICTHHSRRLGPRSARAPVRCNASSSDKNNDKSFVENMINGLTVAIQGSPLAQGKKQLAILQAGEYDEAAVRGVVDKYIADNKVMMFSFSTCPFCKNAKKLLDDMGVGYTAIELNEMEGGMAIRAELAKKTGRTSMPNIWIGGEGIGGCNDGPGIMTLHKNGELEGMLKQCGAL